jgi:hypothetical protein
MEHVICVLVGGPMDGLRLTFRVSLFPDGIPYKHLQVPVHKAESLRQEMRRKRLYDQLWQEKVREVYGTGIPRRMDNIRPTMAAYQRVAGIDGTFLYEFEEVL